MSCVLKNWPLHEDSDKQTRIVNSRFAKPSYFTQNGYMCACLHLCVCAHVHNQTSSSFGTLTEPLTPLAHQAAEPSGWEILSEWRQWEVHVPSSIDPVWAWWDERVCVRVCARVHASLWCFCPLGCQIMVKVPTGSFHKRGSGYCQHQVTATRCINQDWAPREGDVWGCAINQEGTFCGMPINVPCCQSGARTHRGRDKEWHHSKTEPPFWMLSCQQSW